MPDKTLHYGGWAVDTAAHLAVKGRSRVALTKTEMQIFTLLAENAGHTVPRSALLRQIWGGAPQVETRIVDAYIARLRKKLQLGDMLITVYRKGYLLKSA